MRTEQPDFPSVESQDSLPMEMLRALDRYVEEFRTSVGTWQYRIGSTNYRVSFTLTQSIKL